MKRKQRLWLAREKTTHCVPKEAYYSLGTCPPTFNECGFVEFPTGEKLKSFCPADFKAITGVRLRPGEIREVVSITVRLKPRGMKAKRK